MKWNNSMNAAPVALMICGLLLLTACDKRIRKNGSGVVTVDTRNVESFTQMDVDGSYELFLHQSDVNKVEVTTDDNIQEEVHTFVQGGKLFVEMSDDYFNYDYTRMEVHVYTSSFQNIALNGSVNVNTPDTIVVNNFEINHNGSGHSVLKLSGHYVKLSINGTGRIEAQGLADECELHINGSGKVDALDLPVSAAKAIVNGSGDIYVNASSTLDANIDGEGSIRYLGNPSVTSHINGSGNISPY